MRLGGSIGVFVAEGKKVEAVPRFLVTTSDGKLFDEHMVLKEQLDKLRIEQRSLARKKKFGSNWIKEKKKISKLYRTIARKRSDFHHKLSKQFIDQNQTIVIEDLKLTNMTSSAKGSIDHPGTNVKTKSGLNRTLLDAGLGQFSNLLEYKADWYGRTLLRIDPKYTSQICNKCKHKEQANRKRTKFVCLSCGHRDHADVNAAKNILARAMANGSKRKAVA